jgi:8-oxo-dGTP diphosphatase
MSLNMRAAARAVLLDDARPRAAGAVRVPDRHGVGTAGRRARSGRGRRDVPARELREELGLRAVEIGPRIWTREHVIPMRTGHDGQRDHVHLVRVAHFEPVPEIGWEALRDELVHEMRWWSVDEIAAAGGSPSSPVRFAPSRLAMLLRELVAHGPPASPIDTGI